jgi:selenocysteine-specific elongation factor
MSLLESIVSRIGLYHQEHPDLTGFPIETLRHDYLKQLPHPSLWKSLLAALTQDHGLEQAGEFLCHPDHHVALPDRLEAMAAKLMKQLSEHPLDPPYRRHIDLTTEAGDTLRCLIRMGKIIELNSEMVMIREAFDQLVDQTRNWLLKEKSSTVSQIKQALGISRRVAIPFLEKIDREGLTQRHGDQRSWKA